MKTIQPVNVWSNGQVVQATIFNLVCVYDSLSTYANFNYQLLTDNPTIMGVGNQVAQGSLNMTGETYNAWETNQQAWEWGAAQLNLIITGDYVPPVPPPPTTTEVPVENKTTNITT